MSERSFAGFRLPSGRHGLSRRHVVENQRWRLLGATAVMFAEEGYLRTTAHGVAKRAAVSSSTFYEQFHGVDACLLAAFEVCAEDLQTSLTVSGSVLLEPPFASLLGLELRGAVPPVAEAFDRLVDALVAAIGERRWGPDPLGRTGAFRLRLWVLAALSLLGSACLKERRQSDMPTELAELLEACA
ncbi:MAG: helix-turn-helix domain-containing protein [Solirubrobacterales bacterium]